jgi:hypothetical protein
MAPTLLANQRKGEGMSDLDQTTTPTETKKPRTAKRGTSHIVAAMRKRYPANAYAVLFEVGDSTGFKCSRHADAIVMSLWPSRGLHVTGFEFKASRSDWLKELSQPEKAEAVLKYCDFWTVVVAEREIVKDGELPTGWGLMCCDRDTLKTIAEPTKLTPVPLSREFVAAVLRSVSDPIAAVDDTAIRNAEWRGQETANKRSEVVHAELNKKILELDKTIRDFEEQAGVSIKQRWSGLTPKEFRAAIDAAHDGTDARIADLAGVLRVVDGIANTIRGGIDGLKKFATAEQQQGGGP